MNELGGTVEAEEEISPVKAPTNWPKIIRYVAGAFCIGAALWLLLIGDKEGWGWFLFVGALCLGVA